MEPTKVVGRRVAAFIIDGIIATAVYAAVFFALAKTETEVLQDIRDGDLGLADTIYGNFTIGDSTYSVYGSSAALFGAISLAFLILYWVVLPGIKGWTPGKLMLDIRVVKDDGTLPCGVGRSFMRWFLWIADAFPYFIPYLTGFILAMTGERNQRIGDRAANTLVVRTAAVGNLTPSSPAGAPPPPLAPEFEGGSAPNWPS